PDPVFLDVLILVRAFRPATVFAGHAAHDQRAPAPLGRLAIRCDVYDTLHDRGFADLAVLQALTAVREEFADALLADVHALLGELDGGRGAVGEQRGGFAAHAFAHVVAVRLLQPFDRLRIFQQADLLIERCELRFEDGDATLLRDHLAVGDDWIGGMG